MNKGNIFVGNTQEVFFDNIIFQNDIIEIIQAVRRQNYYTANIKFKNIINKFQISISWILCNINVLKESICYISEEYVINLLEMIKLAQEEEDYVLLGDLFEKEVLSLVENIQNCIMLSEDINHKDYFDENISWCKNKELVKELKERDKLIENNFSIEVELTNSGALTCYCNNNGKRKYIHSNINPFKEANIFAENYMEDGEFEYVIYGLGLGYHIAALLEKDERIKITVLESNINILLTAFHCIDLKEILNSKRVIIQLVKTRKDFNEQLKDVKNLVIHYPSIFCIEDKKIKELLEDFYLSYNSIKNQKRFLDTNFYYNKQNNVKFVDDLEKDFKDKTMILVAAGPSLEDDLVGLKRIYDSKNENVVIVAVGTIAKKLIEKGIVPQFIAIADASYIIKTQIEGIDKKSTLLYLSTSSHAAVETFKGNKYMVCQEGFEEVEIFAKKYNLHKFETGGSVSTVILSIGLYFKCRKIVCVGLDLAYTKEQSHAFEENKKGADKNNLRLVPGIEDEYVYTRRDFDIFRKWIERRIEGEKTEIINTSKGANIKGMINCNLIDLKL